MQQVARVDTVYVIDPSTMNTTHTSPMSMKSQVLAGVCIKWPYALYPRQYGLQITFHGATQSPVREILARSACVERSRDRCHNKSVT